MKIVVRKSAESEKALQAAMEVVGSESIIMVRTRKLVKIDKNNSQGVSRIFLSRSKNIGIIKKLGALFESNMSNLCFRKEGGMEICFSL
jgi:hypothetical protein